MTIISAQPLQTISYWSKNGTVLSPKSSERVDLSEIRAKDGNGLKLYEDSGAGIFIKDGGNVGINENDPDCKFHIKDGAILAEGTTGGTPTSGGGTRLMWIPAKGAFRVGTVSWPPDIWDDVNIGYDSIAFGNGVKASGVAATAFGNMNEASGAYSTIFGCGGVASGDSSTVFGCSGTASGYSSTHFGHGGIAAGDNSIVGGCGMQLSAAADNSFAFGYSPWPPITLTQPNVFYIFPGGTAGKVAVGTQTPATSAIMDLTSTIGALLLPRMTTAQRDALTAVNGMVIYSTSNNCLEAYENGAWVNL